MASPLPKRQWVRTSAGRLEFMRSGQGGPVWLLFNGAGMGLEAWQRLYPGVEQLQLGTVFAWNRLGVGRSDRPVQPQSGRRVIRALSEALDHLDLGPPYVLVGHSLGGMHAQLFARLFPQDVAGVLLLDATHPQEREHGRGHETRIAKVLDRLFPLPKSEFRANLEAELAGQSETAREVHAAGAFPAVPLIVLTGAQTPPAWLADPQAVARRREHQRELARLSALGEQVMAWRSGHFPQRSEPALVLRAMGYLAARIKNQAVRPL